CKPAYALAIVFVLAALVKVKVSVVPSVLQHTERITRVYRIMNDETSLCSLSRCFFVLVCPATIVCHGVDFKERRIIATKARIIDQYNYDLVFHIQTFVVVPVVFGCDDTKAGEYEFLIFPYDEWVCTFGVENTFVAALQCQRA